MLTITNTETRLCILTQREVVVVISHKDTLLTGLGGMLVPRHPGAVEVDCPYAAECAEASRNCVWALGTMKSINDPLGLKVRF